MKKNESYEELVKGIWRDNPVFVQVLGMCPMLAVTNSAINAIAMGMASMFVLVGSSFLVSAFRHVIPKQVRISCFIIIIATFVTIADYTLLALVPKVHKELGAFIPLIVANCLILGRQEAFASKNNPLRAIVDAVGMGLGFTITLTILGGVREILGNRTLFGFQLLPDAFEPWIVMILPAGAFLTLGLMLGLANIITHRREEAALKTARLRAAAKGA